MDMDVLEHTLLESVKSILPHKSEDEAHEIVQFLYQEGVKKEADLRRMTISNLKNICDTVDSSDLYDEWQNQYAVKKNSEQPSSSRSAPRTTEPLSHSNIVDLTASYTVPVIDKDSLCIPAGVRKAIVKLQRPTQKDRRVMVERIVDHILEIIPHFKRSDFYKVADQLVETYKESFKDTIPISNLGSDSLRRQLQVRYDNLNRNDDEPTSQRNQNPSVPAAYGCLNWNPPLPDGDSEANQIKVRGNLKKMLENTMRHWEWRKVKSEMEMSYYLLRKNINGSIADKPSRKRSRTANPDDELTEKAMTVEELKFEWPCLFKPIGMNYHFLLLTGVDFYVKLDMFMADKGRFLIDFLASKGEERGRERTNMTIYERRGNTDAALVALIKLLLMHFKEKLDALTTFVEESIELHEVDTDELPKDNTPHLVVAGPHLHEITNIFLAIDGKIVKSCETFRDGFTMLFCAYFVLNIQYPLTLAGTLSYVQKVVAGITPDKGTKCQSSSEQQKINKKVTKLSNDFAPYYESFTKENTEP